MNKIDLRSDTVTKPCDNMRQAIFSATVGDDVVGEDPSVNKLQELGVAISGKEMALFVPSATMANQLAIKAMTVPGDAIATVKNAHLYRYESGASAIFSGVTNIAVGNDLGEVTSSEIKDIIPIDDAHFPPLRLVCLENTHNGHILPLQGIEELSEFCKIQNIPMHLDGARIFNASVATNVAINEYAKHFETVTFCLSKGLGAPVGALICSDKKHMKKIHRFRKAMGGGMRQAGIIAAAGVYALENNIERLKEDHENAKYLSEKLQEIPGIKVTNLPIETNMVFADFSDCKFDDKNIIEFMKLKNILLYFDENKKSTRLVTHLDINKSDLLHFCDSLRLFFE